jgi:hypothetical protein
MEVLPSLSPDSPNDQDSAVIDMRRFDAADKTEGVFHLATPRRSHDCTAAMMAGRVVPARADVPKLVAQIASKKLPASH